MPARQSIISNLRYDDANAAIAFLCEAFGFAEHAVFRDEQGKVSHAQLVISEQMVMLADALDTPFARAAKMASAGALGGNSQSLYVIVADVDGHCARAREKGATIILEPVDQDYGGRGYSALDPQGVAWSFGNYDPWAEA